jgi:hypothetical protein
VTAGRLEGLVDGGEDPVGGMGRACDVRVGQYGQELRRGAAEDSRRVDVAHCARERGRHRLQRLIGGANSVGLDEQDAEVALIPVGASELVLEHGAHEAIVEETGGAVDDVKRLGLWVVDLDAA